MKIIPSGPDLLNDSRLNKGTAFTDNERDTFSLHGLLPPHVETLAEQRKRGHQELGSLTVPIERYEFMRELQDTNETLFLQRRTRTNRG